MQGATWANGQCRQSTHPSHLSHNTSSNHGSNTAAYFLPSSNDGVGAMVGHFSMQGVGTKQMSTQRRNILTANNQISASGHQGYPNATQNATFTATPTANMNAAFKQHVMYAQNTSAPLLSSMLLSNVKYYEPQVMHQNLNSRTENVTAHMKNPTSASTTQAVYNMQQQTPLQSCMYSQPSAQTAGGPQTLPSYSQAVSVKRLCLASSHVPGAQIVQEYTAIPVTQFATSFVNNSTTKQSDQANYGVPQKNAFKVLRGCNGAFFLQNNATSLGNSLTAVPVQTHCHFNQNQEHVQQLAVSRNGAVQTTQPVILTTNCNASPMGLPSPTENKSERFQLKKRLAPPQTIATTNDFPNTPLGNLESMFLKKINGVPSVNLNAPLYRASQINRGEAFEQIETVVLAGQATNGATLMSPGRAQRAVAVVLPLSQENAPDDHPSPTSKPSPNASSSPSFCSSDQTKNFQTSGLKEKSPKLTSDCDVSSEKANVQNPSLNLKRMLSTDDPPPPRLSNLPLTFAQLVKGPITQTPHISGRQKNSVNRKTPTETKPCQEPLSSVPTTEWTLEKLHLEIKLREASLNEKSENTIEPVDQQQAVKELIRRFWNGGLKNILIAARSGGFFHQTEEFKEVCRTLTEDTVILSQRKSQNDLNAKYHVLQQDEVYKEEIPYISSWLNTNSQLDDIDKEFGLPFFFKCSQEYGEHADTQGGVQDNSEAGLKSVNSEEAVTQSDKLDQGIKSVDSKSNNIDVEIQNESKLSETDSPKDGDENQCDSNVESSDPNVESSDPSYSFQIEVLSPAKAKVIFEQLDPQMACPSKLEATEPNAQNDAKRPTCSATTLETVCCIEKWKEKVFGLASEGTCKCKVINDDEEPQLHSADDNSWTMDFFDLTNDDSPTVPPKATGDMQEGRSPDNKSAILVLSESEDEDQVSKDDQTSQSKDNEQNFAKSAEEPHVVSSDKNALDTLMLLFHISENAVSETTCTKEQKMKEQNEDCRMKMEKPAILQHSPSDDLNKLGKKADEDIPDLSSSHPSKKLKPSSHLRSQTIFESFSKCRKTASISSVELTLFGSRQEKCASQNTRRSHSWYDKSLQPPERIYVNMNPSTNDQEKEPLSKVSVKRRIHENWMKSFPLATIKIRKKNKNFAIVGKFTSPSKIKLKGSKRKAKDSDDGLHRKRRRTRGVEKSVDLIKKLDIEVKPLEENILKFNVLPSTFSFEDEPQNVDSMTDSTAADEKTSPGKAAVKTLVLKTQGAWRHESRDKSPVQSTASSTESLGLFQEFQKKHKMRRRSSDQ